MCSIDNTEILLQNIVKILQDSLIRGWEELKISQSYKVYEEAFQFFMKAGLYEGLFRPYIPNPVYDNAAKELGRDFLNKSIELNLAYKELFPGNFILSTEKNFDGLDYRTFFLTAYMNIKKICIFKITFSHCHEYFDFPTAPLLEIMET